MTPAEQLFDDLSAARRDGERFADAWPAAVTRSTEGLAGDDLEAWRSACHSTRAAWLAAWLRRPASRVERALSAVSEDGDREPLGAGGERLCAVCGDELPATAKGRTCTRSCAARSRQLAA